MIQVIKNYRSKEFQAIEPEELINMVREDESLKARTALHRELLAKADAATDKEESGRITREAKMVKEGSPQAAVGFSMKGGKEKRHCQECQYMVLVDFDAKTPDERLEPKELERVKTILRTSRHALMGYESISGLGYHIVVPFRLPEGITIDLAADFERGETIFKRAHACINKMYSVWCGHGMDESCGNINRMMGLGHDPLGVYREEAVPVMLTREQLGIDAEGNFIKMKSPRWAVSKQGKRMPVKLGDSMEQAVKMVEEGGTVFASGSHHDFVMRVSFILNRMGVDEEEAAQALDDAYRGMMSDRPSGILHSCYRTASDEFGVWMQRRSDVMIKTEIVKDFLKDLPLQYDVLTQKTQQKTENGIWKEMTDRDKNDLYMECCATAGMNLTSQLFMTVLNSNIIRAVNPLKNYVQSLAPWSPDQPDYINMVADMVHMGSEAEDELWHKCFKKWLVAMVAGWQSEYVVNHQVFVLVGKQGIYKSTWINRLLPPELRAYGTDNFNIERIDKDEKLRAAEYGLINIDELDKLSERELNKVKAMITNTHIDERASYGHNKEKRVKVASYAASGNKIEFLTDLTGNRRWLPFHVLSINSPFDNEMPYAGMYAQADYLRRHGFNYWFSLDDTEAMKSHVEGFMVPDKVEQLLLLHFDRVEEDDPQATFLTTAEISAKLTIYGSLRKDVDIRRLGSILSNQGFIKKRNGHLRTRGFLVRERTVDEIKEMRNPKNLGADNADISPF